MNKSSLPSVENVKVLRGEERMGTMGEVITSKDARKLGIPANCVVIPMQVLARPEPIKRKRK